MADENLIKQTCKELGLTYKQLGERLGISEGAIRNSVTNNRISDQLNAGIELLKEIEELKTELKDYKELKSLLTKIVK
ncbi:hypothetical protein BB381_06995 [Campylobacter pinnipediorum subsp. caledonicus]|uniref:transcriptional regulator n=1 Tax=Campylobacter pinnipediorum TaxID=1965231 RepID=UPI000994EBAD|nr:transcriptional regulator [Campylobacter pinnipediorum]OPA71875.1 hypothetical protein BB381_06995 [Campylobacter pinnipediorum subsp. caledonicus]